MGDREINASVMHALSPVERQMARLSEACDVLRAERDAWRTRCLEAETALTMPDALKDEPSSFQAYVFDLIARGQLVVSFVPAGQAAPSPAFVGVIPSCQSR